MIYQSTSMSEVLGRIARNTRLQDTSLLKSAEEWIPEAMGYMRTKYQLQPRYQDVCIEYYKGRLPCGLVTLSAVQYGRSRLRYYSSPRTPEGINNPACPADSVYPGIPLAGTTTFGTHLVKRGAEDDGIPVEFYETNLCPIDDCMFHGEHWYYTEMGYISTSIRDTWLRIHYKGIPLDGNGLPLIPDEENYKEALYYYCRAKMIGAGYEDRQFTEDKCMTRYEQYAEKAIRKISYPSVDQVESRMLNLNRLWFPENYWDTFYDPPVSI